MNLKSCVLAAALVGVTMGCRPIHRSETAARGEEDAAQALRTPPAGSITEEHAARIALDAVKARSGTNRVEFEVGTVKYHTNRCMWGVTVWRLPATPGRYLLVMVSPRGEVVEMLPGH